MGIDSKLLKEITSYCKLNNIEDIDGLINKMLKVGFDIEKFGPNMSVNKPKIEEIKETKKNTTSTKKNTTKKVEKKKVVEDKNPKVENNKSEQDLYGE